MTCKRHRKGVNEGLGRGCRRGPPSLPLSLSPSLRPPGGGAAAGAGGAGAAGGTVPYVTRGTCGAGGDYVSGTSAPVAQDTSRRHRGGQGRRGLPRRLPGVGGGGKRGTDGRRGKAVAGRGKPR